jgi:hypothetical protein
MPSYRMERARAHGQARLRKASHGAGHGYARLGQGEGSGGIVGELARVGMRWRVVVIQLGAWS